jgi:hypothetical protein
MLKEKETIKQKLLDANPNPWETYIHVPPPHINMT